MRESLIHVLNFILQAADLDTATSAKFTASVNFENAEDLVNDTLFLRVNRIHTYYVTCFLTYSYIAKIVFILKIKFQT